jgi:hypothetical protein
MCPAAATYVVAPPNARRRQRPRDVPHPASATHVWHWASRGKVLTRDFEGTERKVGRVTVYITGTQFIDGHCERRIALTGPGDGSSRTLLSPTLARKLATALGDAADEIERLTD